MDFEPEPTPASFYRFEAPSAGQHNTFISIAAFPFPVL
jgi:hypothetical protein